MGQVHHYGPHLGVQPTACCGQGTRGTPRVDKSTKGTQVKRGQHCVCTQLAEAVHAVQEPQR